MKICRQCDERKPLSQFPGVGGGRKRPDCKVCYNKKQAEYREKNRERLQEQWRTASNKYYEDKSPAFRRRLNRHGITEQEYNALVKEQGGKCAICSTKDDLVIDHCHDTLRVRGILCNSCNKALGYLKDSLDSLEAAKSYLTKPPAYDIINDAGWSS